MFCRTLLLLALASKCLCADWTVGQKFQILLESVPTITNNVKIIPTDAVVFDIDVFDSDATTIAALKSQGHLVICYFSAGTYEPWRPDASSFTAADRGSSLAPEWPDEYWLNLNSTNVRKIIQSRIELAGSKGCDGIDPDNVDGYANTNGLNLQPADSVNLIKYMVDIAGPLGMGVGLKNALAIIPQVTDIVDFAVNEQCVQYAECQNYTPFLAAGHPVYHIEYPTNTPVPSNQVSQWCNFTGVTGMSTVIKTLALSGWVEYCDGIVVTTPSGPGTGNPGTVKPHPTTTVKTRTSATKTTTKTTTSKTSAPTTIRTTSTKTSSSAAPTQTQPGGGNGCTSKHWDQCGGQDWKGCTVCAAGFTCKGVSPPYYYQCL